MKFFIKKVFEYANYLSEVFPRIKTILWYKQLFRGLGNHSVVFKPLRLINPQNITIGDRVRIYKGSRIETIESWGNTKFTPELIVGNGTTFEQFVHIICASRVEIGKAVVISAGVMITDNNHEYKEINKSVMEQPLEVKDKTVIGDFCFVGMGSRIMAGARLGNNCIVGANSVVLGEFKDYSVIVGSPAKIIKRYDLETSKWRKTTSSGEFIDEV